MKQANGKVVKRMKMSLFLNQEDRETIRKAAALSRDKSSQQFVERESLRAARKVLRDNGL